MRTVVLCLAVVISACATDGAAPTIYGQGIPVAPRPPAFSPTLDAPITTGQPGYIGPAENLPRSPYGRMLPQTPETRKEAGIWAANSPKDAPAVHLDDDLSIPLPENASPEAISHAKRCGAAVYKVFTGDKELEQILLRALDEPRKCMLALSWRYCMKSSLWPEEERDADKRLLEYANKTIGGTKLNCHKWEDALKDFLDSQFNPGLRSWYYNTYLPRSK